MNHRARRPASVRTLCTMSAGLFLLLVAALPARAQLVSGRVIEEGSERPIVDATIELADSAGQRRASTLSDTAGNFRLFAPAPGVYVLRVMHIGYASMETKAIEAEIATEVQVELRLNPSAVPLEPLRVVGRASYSAGWLQEYYERAALVRKSGFGRIFLRDDIERTGLPSASAYMIYLQPRGPCRPSIFIDGLQIQDVRQLDSMMQPEILEGVELYNNDTLFPPRYTNRGHCALALFWTRRDVPGGKPLTWKRGLVAGGLAGILLLLMLR